MYLITGVVVPVLISLLMFSYAGYLWVKQGVHVRGKGWMSKEEAPKSFYITVVLMVVLGLGQLISPIFWIVQR